MGRKPLKPLPSLLREKRLTVLERYNDQQHLRQIEDINRQRDIAIASIQGASVAAKAVTESNVKAADAEESMTLKPPQAAPRSFVGAKGQAFLKKGRPKAR